MSDDISKDYICYPDDYNVINILQLCTTEQQNACIGKSSFNFSLKPSRFFAAVKSSVLKIFPVSKALAGNLKENTPGLVRYVLAPPRYFLSLNRFTMYNFPQTASSSSLLSTK